MSELPRADEPRPGRCETCRFWGGVAGDVTEECRRRSPIPDLKDDVATWPVTLGGDWCGEWLAKDKAAWMAHVVAEDRRVKGK